MATERGQVKVDLQRFQNALDNNLDESVFNSASLKNFIASKSTTFRVTSNMFIPSFLVAVHVDALIKDRIPLILKSKFEVWRRIVISLLLHLI